jgi:hypothetical protein
MTYWVPQQLDWEQQLKYYGGMPRLAELEELGGAYVYLLSDAASYTTSIDIPVNGIIGSKSSNASEPERKDVTNLPKSVEIDVRRACAMDWLTWPRHLENDSQGVGSTMWTIARAPVHLCFGISMRSAWFAARSGIKVLAPKPCMSRNLDIHWSFKMPTSHKYWRGGFTSLLRLRWVISLRSRSGGAMVEIYTISEPCQNRVLHGSSSLLASHPLPELPQKVLSCDQTSAGQAFSGMIARSYQ